MSVFISSIGKGIFKILFSLIKLFSEFFKAAKFLYSIKEKSSNFKFISFFSLNNSSTSILLDLFIFSINIKSLLLFLG